MSAVAQNWTPGLTKRRAADPPQLHKINIRWPLGGHPVPPYCGCKGVRGELRMSDDRVSQTAKEIIAKALSQWADQPEANSDRQAEGVAEVVDTLIHDLD